VGLEACAREESAVSNPGGRLLELSRGWTAKRRAPSPQSSPSEGEEDASAPGEGSSLVSDREPISPAPAATEFWPHRLRVAFAGKEESRGAYRLDKIGR